MRSRASAIRSRTGFNASLSLISEVRMAIYREQRV
jgi:hypothetical protein